MATGNPYNETFAPYDQNISIIAPNGIDPIMVPLQTVAELQLMATHMGIMFGVQIGMVAILLLVLAMVTKPQKWRSVVFVLNTLALIFILIRNIFQCIEVTGPFYNYYNWVAGYYENVEDAKQLSETAECMSFLIDLVIELSLMFQVHIVCCTLRSIWRKLLLFVSILVVLMTVGVRFALMVLNIRDNIAIVGQSTDEQWDRINRLASASNICLMTSIIFFSLIFCIKLAHAIFQRRKLGIKQFGPIQIIFVMGCQTLIIPAIFGFLSYVVLKNMQVNSFMPVIVAIFLPLSAMWATTNAEHSNIAAPFQANNHANVPIGPDFCNSASANSRAAGLAEKERLMRTFGSSTFAGSTVNTLVTNNTCHSAYSPKSKAASTLVTARGSHDSIDCEPEKLGRQINVKRTASVSSRQEV